MVEEFETGVCGANWWNNLMMISNPSRTCGGGGGFVGGGSSFCSLENTTAAADFGEPWIESCKVDDIVSNNSSVSDGSAPFQNDSDSGGSTNTAAAAGEGLMMDSSALSSSDWNHQHRTTGGASERIDHESNYDWCNGTAEDPLLNNLSGLSNDHRHHFSNIDQQQPSLKDDVTVATCGIATATYGGGYPSTLIQSLFESDVPHQPAQLFSDSLLLTELPSSSSSSWRPEFQRPNHNNNSHTSTCPNVSTTKQPKKEEGSNGKDSKSGTKKGSSEPAFKRPRIETPSPLPTFKVRKEKLGDRVTALQQLVSPFGKTDRASVLHEAIDYIKFLHDQVSVLSTPYMKNGNSIHQHQQKDRVGPKLDQEAQNEQDLRMRGLCLVSISSTFPVAGETTADFWTPTFGDPY